MMGRLNDIGWQALISTELENLPTSTPRLYELLVRDCVQNRNSEDREVLRQVLAWIAYAKSRLTMGEATLLISIIRREASFRIDEAFQGPLSRLLRISSGGDEGEETDASNSETDSPSGDGDTFSYEAWATGEATSFVRFQERYLRTFFQKAPVEENSPRCSPPEAQAIILRTITAILTLESEYNPVALLEPDMHDVALTRLAGLKAYASRWVFSHLRSIDIDKVSDKSAASVLECLFDLLSNKNGCLKILELQAYNRQQVILEAEDADAAQTLEVLQLWSKRAVDMTTDFLPPTTREFFMPIANEPRKVFFVLAKAHVQNWPTAANIGMAGASLQCAIRSLMRCKDLPVLQEYPILKNYLEGAQDADDVISVESALAVFHGFHDIEKTPSSYKGLSMALWPRTFVEEAQKQCDIGLSLPSVTDIDRFHLQQSKGIALYMAPNAWNSEDERKLHFQRALKQLGEATKICLELKRKGALSRDDEITCPFTFIYHAQAAAIVGEFDFVLGSIRSAATSAFWHLYDMDLGEIIVDLARAKQYHLVVDVLQALSKVDVALMFCTSDPQTQACIEESAQRADRTACLLDLYRGASSYFATTPDPLLADVQSFLLPRMTLLRATFTQQVLRDAAKAKKLLAGIVASPHTDYRIAEPAANALADLFFEEFRLAADPHAKAAALQELRHLTAQLVDALGGPDSFRPAEAPIAVVLGLMLGTMGPALECADVLRGAFAACVGMLTDGAGDNDSMALRHLARVVACVGDAAMARDACIAASAQLYVLEGPLPAEQAQGGEEGHPAPAEGERYKEESLADLASSNRSGRDDAARDGLQVAVARDGDKEAADEFVLSDEGRFYCNDCCKPICDWSKDGPAYLCVYCTNCDLCEECFAKKTANESGGEKHWHVVCPEGHKHVKAPAEGWKGVNRAGQFVFEDKKLAFRDWLRDLEAKWDAYWQRYWSAGLT